MKPGGKWIDRIEPDTTVEAAARTALERRLSDVLYWLPAAAYCAEHDVEYVHRLRVSTRRAIAALRLYGDWLPSKRARWLKKRLKKIRRAAGDARDLDVLANRVEQQLEESKDQVTSEISKRRESVQPAIRRIAERCLRKQRFARNVNKLLGDIKWRGRKGDQCSGPFRTWARERLTGTADLFFAAMPKRDDDVAALHTFRIQGKALRYSIELLAPAFGLQLRDNLYPVVEELQERLGQINDRATGANRLRTWATDKCPCSRKDALADLAQRESAAMDAALAEFRDWWTADRADALRRGLQAESGVAQPVVDAS
jgi:CHAD domain-containing protein